jgi:hypothetical protein
VHAEAALELQVLILKTGLLMLGPGRFGYAYTLLFTGELGELIGEASTRALEGHEG